jgi:hypothetical protein
MIGILKAFWRIRRERRRIREETRRTLLIYLQENEFSLARDALREMREPPRRECCDSEAAFRSVAAQWRAIHGVSIGEQHADNN